MDQFNTILRDDVKYEKIGTICREMPHFSKEKKTLYWRSLKDTQMNMFSKKCPQWIGKWNQAWRFQPRFIIWKGGNPFGGQFASHGNSINYYVFNSRVLPAW